MKPDESFFIFIMPDSIKSFTKTLTPLGYLGDPAKTDTTGAREFLEESCRMMADAIARSLQK